MLKRIVKNPFFIEIIVSLVIIFLVLKIDSSNEKPSSYYFRKEDIYYEYEAAKQIQKGENPYNKTLEGNKVDNNKYATLFPLYYYFLAVVKHFSNDGFDGFISGFRSVLTYSRLTGGLFIYLIFRRLNKKSLGFIAAAIYMFNLWSLESFILLKQDSIAIALLLASVYFFNKRNWLSYLLFGLSLGIKHIGVFVFPLYLTPLLFKEQRIKEFCINMMLLAAPVVISSLPFLMDNYQSLLASLEFSFTRTPKDGQVIFGYQELLIHYSDSGLNGTTPEFILPRLPLFLAILANIYLLYSKKIPRSFYLLTATMTFAIFNPVIFAQYVTWITPLVFISIADFFSD